jgi:hypothetical protein
MSGKKYARHKEQLWYQDPDWARARNISVSYRLIPHTVIGGGIDPLSSPIMQEDTGLSSSFFVPAVVCVSVSILLITRMILIIFAGSYLLSARNRLIEVRDIANKSGQYVAKVQVIKDSAFVGIFNVSSSRHNN